MTARTLLVERPGLQSLIVDRGRLGLRHVGVAWCGAMDMRAYAIAQQLVGNDAGAAAIEIVYGDVDVRFESAARCALTGAECGATLDDRPVAAWTSFEVPSGARLRLRRPRAGVRTILAVDGGIDVPVVLGSRTTDLVARMGGIEGRALRAGDRLPFGAARAAPEYARAQPPRMRGEVRAIAQPGFDALWARPWTIGHESNRMGYRLRGDAVPHDVGAMRSRAVFPGVIQLPPSGEPIVLASDAQTTGGYPVAGVVIEEDLWMLAQLAHGSEVRFECVSI